MLANSYFSFKTHSSDHFFWGVVHSPCLLWVPPMPSVSLHHHRVLSLCVISCGMHTCPDLTLSYLRVTTWLDSLSSGPAQRDTQQTFRMNGWISDWWRAKAGRCYVMIQSLPTRGPGKEKKKSLKLAALKTTGTWLFVTWTIYFLSYYMG